MSVRNGGFGRGPPKEHAAQELSVRKIRNEEGRRTGDGFLGELAFTSAGNNRMRKT